MGRSILAVIAGFIAWSILWVGSNAAVTAVFPQHFAADGTTQHNGILALILLDSILFSLFAGWLTAKIAHGKTFAHTLALGLALLAVGIPVQIGYWDLMPLWYHLIFLTLLLPMAILGGKIQAGRAGG